SAVQGLTHLPPTTGRGRRCNARRGAPERAICARLHGWQVGEEVPGQVTTSKSRLPRWQHVSTEYASSTLLRRARRERDCPRCQHIGDELPHQLSPSTSFVGLKVWIALAVSRYTSWIPGSYWSSTGL